MFLKSMICTQGFLYWIWGMLKNTNFLGGRKRTARYEVGGDAPRDPGARPRSPRPLARLPRRVVIHGHNLHGALENDVALAEILQRPPHGEAPLHRHGGGPAPPAPPPEVRGSTAPQLRGRARPGRRRPRGRCLRGRLRRRRSREALQRQSRRTGPPVRHRRRAARRQAGQIRGSPPRDALCG